MTSYYFGKKSKSDFYSKLNDPTKILPFEYMYKKRDKALWDGIGYATLNEKHKIREVYTHLLFTKGVVY